MVQLGDKGVSDVVVIAIMFVLLVFSATLLFGITSSGLDEAADRQVMLKTQYIYQSLNHVQVEKYNVTALRAASEHLVFKDPTVPNEFLKSWMENTLDFFRPLDYGVRLRLSRENKSWEVIQPDGVTKGETFRTEHPITFTGRKGESITVDVLVETFEISE